MLRLTPEIGDMVTKAAVPTVSTIVAMQPPCNVPYLFWTCKATCLQKPMASINCRYVKLAEAEVTFGVTKSVHVTFPRLAFTFCKPLRAAESKLPGSLFSRRCCIIFCSKALELYDHDTIKVDLRSLQ